MIDDNKKAVLGFFEAVSDRRVEDLPQYVAQDVVDHNKIIHGEPDEPGAAFEGLRQQLAAFDPLTVQVEELIGEGDQVVARVIQRGVHSGTHPRMPEPTGRSFENEAIWILTLTEGKISGIRAVSDRLGLFFQLGWPWPQTD
ncbi:ester cyclase [Kribbella monticola]|uniref:ester cyclase n=1 Tax=Kribbella monticola TaxID=2185285 RepID=UPI0018E4E710|nr:ester cyclase [Kribbella monticola]